MAVEPGKETMWDLGNDGRVNGDRDTGLGRAADITALADSGGRTQPVSVHRVTDDQRESLPPRSGFPEELSPAEAKGGRRLEIRIRGEHNAAEALSESCGEAVGEGDAGSRRFHSSRIDDELTTGIPAYQVDCQRLDIVKY
ncbi:MAG: hypothetical protein HYX75_10675 [Acidobacteria bacterium]|nr:hypothetical protein [Acidobacteriota bacterium]